MPIYLLFCMQFKDFYKYLKQVNDGGGDVLNAGIWKAKNSIKSWATSTQGALTIVGAATFAYIAALKALDKQFSLTYKRVPLVFSEVPF